MFNTKLIINGVKSDARDGATFDRSQPISEKVVTPASSATIADAMEAANVAAAAFPVWSQMSNAARSDILTRAADLLLERADDLVEAVAQEIGGSESWAGSIARLRLTFSGMLPA